MTRRALLAVLVCAAGCAVPPQDPYARAEFELAQDDLLEALRAYDAVPASHPRYPDARAAAVVLEVRMRRCQELLLDGLRLRSEWRDAEALEQFRRAAEQWPAEPGLRQWIAVTEQRVATFGRAAPSDPVALPAAPSVEVAVDVAASDPARASAPSPVASAGRARPDPAPTRAVPARSIEGAAAGKPAAAVSVQAPASEPRATSSEATAALRSVDALLERGQQQEAIAALERLAARFPRDPRVSRRWVSCLHQRALLRYGKGQLAAAVADWRELLALDPSHRAAQRMSARAQIELQRGQ